MHRRALLTAAACALTALSGAARAQSYPTKPITFVVPAPAGGGSDAIARALAEQMSKGLGQAIVIDNRPGAAGIMGTQVVARAAADGYTILLGNTGPVAYAPFMFNKLPYDVQKDLVAVTDLCSVSMVFTVHKDVPAKNMREFVAWAQKNKGKLNYGSYGLGSASHLISEHLNRSRSLDMTHAAYKGESPMAMAVVSGEVHAAVGTLATMAPFMASGQVRTLAVLGENRLSTAPELPTIREAGFDDPEFMPIGGLIMMAPAGIPAPVLARLEQEARAAIHSTPLKARFQVFGMVGVGNSSADAQKSLRATAPMIQKLIQSAGVKPQ
jgi:tripartite-type tricarboxylate transporter receptor subunit TctC